MMKKILNPVFALAFVFSLNAKNADQIISKEFGDKNFKITIEYNSSTNKNDKNNEKLILETITKLTKEINPTSAAKEYIEYMKSVFEKFKSESFNTALKDCKSLEESSQQFGSFMQELMSDMSKKENALKQSVYFSALSDAAIQDVNTALSMEMQKFLLEINKVSIEKTKDIKNKTEEERKVINTEIQNAIQVLSNELFDKVPEAIKTALSKHYTI